jgi:hypothetical protein
VATVPIVVTFQTARRTGVQIELPCITAHAGGEAGVNAGKSYLE